jgi:hypothetical protein
MWFSKHGHVHGGHVLITHAYRTYLHVTATQGHSRRHQRTPQHGPPRPTTRWGRSALTLGQPASPHVAMAPSFASCLYHLLWCISTLREGQFHPRATVDPLGLYKAASRPSGLIQSLQIRTSNRIRNQRRRIEEPTIKKKTSSPSSLGIESSLELELEEREKRRRFRRSSGLSDLLQHLVPVDSSSSRSCI